MSTNCVSCIKNERTESDLLCDDCRKAEITQAIEDIECLRQAEINQAQSIEKKYVETDEWYTTEIHYKFANQYDRVLRLLTYLKAKENAK